MGAECGRKIGNMTDLLIIFSYVTHKLWACVLHFCVFPLYLGMVSFDGQFTGLRNA